MSSTKHTPGPWAFYAGTPDDYVGRRTEVDPATFESDGYTGNLYLARGNPDHDGEPVVGCDEYDVFYPHEQGQAASATRLANMRLLAAAPDLLAACERAVDFAEGVVFNFGDRAARRADGVDEMITAAHDMLAAARAAIAKATGGAR